MMVANMLSGNLQQDFRALWSEQDQCTRSIIFCDARQGREREKGTHGKRSSQRKN